MSEQERNEIFACRPVILKSWQWKIEARWLETEGESRIEEREWILLGLLRVQGESINGGCGPEVQRMVGVIDDQSS